MRPDDVFAAALWFLSFFGSDPKEVAASIEQIEIEPRLKQIIEIMTAANAVERPTAEVAAAKVEEVVRA
jgi:hypothetical protein